MNAKQALQEWIKTQSLPVSDVEEHGFINGYNWALKDNEPVAYVTGVKQFDPVMADTVLKVGTPLYTHPAKTLTDEEIYQIAMEVQTGFLPQDDTLAFAKAILRKAQK